MSFGAPTYFHLLWLLPLLILFYAWAFRRKRRALTLFGNPELMGKMTATTSRTRQVWKTMRIALTSLPVRAQQAILSST